MKQPGAKIQALREEKQIGLSDLAGKVHLNQEQLERIESGAMAPSLGVLTKLARALGVRLGTFLDDHPRDRKSTRLNSSHVRISYAVFCLKKKTKKNNK